MTKHNPMQEVKIEKVILSVGGTGENLDKGHKLIERITGKKAVRCKSNKRIPSLNVRPGLEVGAMVTLRGEKAIEVLKRLLAAEGNKIKAKQISGQSFTFGIKEYIEIPGMTYQRDLGIMGLEASVSFYKPGKRVGIRKIKRGKIAMKQRVSKDEVIDYLTAMGVKVMAEKVREKRE